MEHPPLIRSNSPELHLDGIIALGSWQNLPATRKSNVSSESERKSVQGTEREETCKRQRGQPPGTRQGRRDVPGCENLLQLLRSERKGKVGFLEPLAGGRGCGHKGTVIPKPRPEKYLLPSIP